VRLFIWLVRLSGRQDDRDDDEPPVARDRRLR
jgi:hypothetical protein